VPDELRRLGHGHLETRAVFGLQFPQQAGEHIQAEARKDAEADLLLGVPVRLPDGGDQPIHVGQHDRGMPRHHLGRAGRQHLAG